ncbi:Regulator of cytoskeleton and endocytosis [Candida tropicalis]
MSWGGFKKAINRAGASVTVKGVDKVMDKDFDTEERRFKTLKTAGLALQKSSKGYLDSIRQITNSQVTIAEIVSNLYEESKQGAQSVYSNVGSYYLQCVREFDEETVKQLDGPFRETVLDPVTKFANYFTEIDEAIKKRDHKKTDYEQCKSKVRRLIDKPAKDAAKLPRSEKELALAKEIYDELNEQLKTELPQLIALRVPFYDPSFEALVKIQLRFCTEGYSRLAQIQEYLEPSARDDYANGILDGKIDEMLVQMQGLSITTLGGK